MAIRNNFRNHLDFIKILNRNIVNALENNYIDIIQIEVSEDYNSVILNYDDYEFEIAYEKYGYGFINELSDFIDSLKEDIEEEIYCIDDEFDVELLDALESALEEM